MGRERVAIIGADEWAMALARAIGAATSKDTGFEDTVRLWLPHELIDGRRLCDVINDTLEHPCLPGLCLPINVIVERSVCEAVRGATLLVLALSSQHAVRILPQIKRALHPSARALCLVDGIQMWSGEQPVLLSSVVRAVLAVPVSSLIGAELLPDVVASRPIEMIVGAADPACARVWARLLSSACVHIDPAPSAESAELVAALAPVVALAAGFCDGLNAGGNTKAAILKEGLLEIRRAVALLLRVPESSMDVSSCGLAHLLGECYGGHSARCAARFAAQRGRQRWELIELELLGGCRVRGLLVAHKMARALRAHGLDASFPLIARVHAIALLGRPVEHIVPRASHAAEWRALRRRRMALAFVRGVGALAASCLVGIVIFLGQRQMLATALQVDKLGAGAYRTVELASYCAAVGCVHSCLRWSFFGIGARYAVSLVALFALLTAGLYAAFEADAYARGALALPGLVGWLGAVPVCLALSFAPLARAFSKQRLADFLLTVG